MISIIGVLIALILPAIQAAREAARRTSCINNLKQQSLALQNYHGQRKRFPSGGMVHKTDFRPTVSWRVAILPQMEMNSLFEQISPRTDGTPTNTSANRQFVEQYVCPSDTEMFRGSSVFKAASYFGVAGAGKNGQLMKLTDEECGEVYTDGILYAGSQTSISMIQDGASNTLLVGERTYIFSDWLTGVMKAGSPPNLICMSPTKNIRYPLNVDPAQLEAGYYAEDLSAPPGANYDLLFNDLFFGSNHPGGANFTFADGSVHFLDDNLDFTIYQDLATRDGGEIIDAGF